MQKSTLSVKSSVHPAQAARHKNTKLEICLPPLGLVEDASAEYIFSCIISNVYQFISLFCRFLQLTEIRQKTTSLIS